MPRWLCLALPKSSPLPGGAFSLHWLINAGAELKPGQVIARLNDDDATEVRVPDGIGGRCRNRLVREGARVAPGHPLLTFIPENRGEPEGGPRSHTAAPDVTRRSASGEGLAEECSPFAPSDRRSVIIAEVADMRRIRPVAIVGLIFLLGVATTVVTALVYLLLGGLAPLLIGALALSIVALSLVYGEQHLGARGGSLG
jgi:hypothetical protein